MDNHPAADLFPMMSGEEYAALVDDIRTNGLINPIVIFDGKILDGRNRWKACAEAGVKPRTVEWLPTGEITPTAWVVASNLHRRHLTASQRAAIAVDLLPMLEAEARERQLSTLRRGDESPDVAKMPERESGRSREKAGAMLNVGGRYVSEAKKLKETAPKMFDAVKSGEKTISQAKKESARADRIERNAPMPIDARRLTLIHADVADVEIEPVDWIITDPPYPADFLEAWDELASFAARALKPGGSLLAMSGQFHLPEVIGRLSSHGLSYHWTLAYLTPGGQSVQVWPRKVNTFWKPLLWFTNGEYNGHWIGDVARSATNDNDKRFHDWGQSESGMLDIIGRMTGKDDTICDPFAGGGATVAAALALGRRIVAVDRDVAAIKTMRGRFGLAA